MDESEKWAERKRKKSEANKRAYARKKALKENKPPTIYEHAAMLKDMKTKDYERSLLGLNNEHQPLSTAQANDIAKELKDKVLAKTEEIKPALTSSNPSHQLLVKDSVFSRKLSVYLTAALILIFLIANAYFICSEQADFYQLTGYSRPYSIFIALLTESATVLLSYFAVSKQKPILFLVLGPTVLVTFAIIVMGIQRKESVEVRAKKVGELIQGEISNLEKKIAALKVDNKPTATEERNLAAKKKELKDWLKNPADIGDFEAYAQMALRLLSVMWNVIFPGLLAALWISPRRLFPE